eukprot:98034-Prorocentrum_minimum.AAC.1
MGRTAVRGRPADRRYGGGSPAVGAGVLRPFPSTAPTSTQGSHPHHRERPVHAGLRGLAGLREPTP